MANWNLVSTILRITRSFLKDNLRTDGRDTYQFTGSAIFTLTEDYVSSATIKVYKNGVLLSSGYSYNSSTNILTITAILATNDIILVTYSYFDKYSDTELLGYLECALADFSRYGYRKTFRLNDANTEVITIDGVNPDAKESYQLAIITAIETDAMNIDIRTKDFTVTATEKESKSDLIGKAMTQFTTYYGDFSFDEDYQQDVN
jgi:hypothetical protein